MIEDASIVKDTRNVRCAISRKFEHDIDRYIDYLLVKGARSSSEKREKGHYIPPDQLSEKAAPTTA